MKIASGNAGRLRGSDGFGDGALDEGDGEGREAILRTIDEGPECAQQSLVAYHNQFSGGNLTGLMAFGDGHHQMQMGF